MIILFFAIPAYALFKVVACIYEGENKVIKALNQTWIEVLYMILIFIICFIGFGLNNDGIKAGQPLSRYEIGGDYLNGYASLSSQHILTVAVFFILGIIAYSILKSKSYKLSPIIYTICCSLLILNIVFAITYYLHTRDTSEVGEEYASVILNLGFICLSIMYIIELKNSLDKFIEKQITLNIKYKNKFLNILYEICIGYKTMPILWVVSTFPVLIVIQLILVVFGQQPDSFIQLFLDTSAFNYSKVIPPDPIVIPGDSHYLCTVATNGHEKIVKPLRSGIRGNHRILVNRQLLVANAFEHILEEYTPKSHKVIRYIYDKYGYPLSRHIKTNWSADLVYILMKPLEWLFILVLYTIDQNPENRINIQYSELRR